MSHAWLRNASLPWFLSAMASSGGLPMVKAVVGWVEMRGRGGGGRGMEGHGSTGEGRRDGGCTSDGSCDGHNVFFSANKVT